MSILIFIQSTTFRHRLALLSMILLIIGLFLSRAFMSIGAILLALQFFIKPDYGKTIRYYKSQPLLWVTSLLFLLYLVSGINSSNLDYWQERVVLKLPILLMPLGFAALEDIPKKFLLYAVSFFITFICILCILSLVDFGLHYQEILESYKHAKVMRIIANPNHIRFSLMIAIAIALSIYLFLEEYRLGYLFTNKYYWIASAIFLFIFLHIYSVRSGLLALYAASALLLIRFIFINKKYKVGFALLALFITIPILMFLLIPTVRNKVNYMAEDISMFLQHKGANRYSDTNRLTSMQLGISIGLEVPYTGIGVGDLRDEMMSRYSVLYPDVSEERRLIPHNQFVYIFAASGITGLLLFLYFCCYPLVIVFWQKGFLFLFHGVAIITSYLSEATLENQLGVFIYVFFYLLTFSLEHTATDTKEEKAPSAL